MRRLIVCAAVTMVVGLGAVVSAQGKISNAMEFQTAMKTAVGGFQGANKALASGAAADAKAQLATARQNFTMVQDLFASKKIADAAGFAKDLLTNLEAADKALSAATPDVAAAQASLKMAQQSCGSCHKAYREGNGKDMPYAIKAGVF
jgi:cytochrome c556